MAVSALAQMERQILVVPRAEHPQIAKDSGLGGTVTVYVTVDPAGNVVAVGDVSGPGAVCPSVTRADVVALRESARAAAANAKFASSDVATKIPLNFDFPTLELDQLAVGEKHYSAAAPSPEKGDKPARDPNRFTIMGDSRATVKADDKDQSDTTPRAGSSLPPDYTGPVATSSTGVTSAPRDAYARPVPNQISGGVLNGKAVNLPKPAYPPAARAVRAAGGVSVQVLIIENGTVFSASAVSGHPLLRSAARLAACGAEFSPTLLMGNPVKVSGVITYNFVP